MLAFWRLLHKVGSREWRIWVFCSGFNFQVAQLHIWSHDKRMVGNCCTCSCISGSHRLHTESKSTGLLLSHLPLPNHDSKADKSAQERGAQYMDWDKSATPDAKDSGTYRQWPSTWVGNLLHNVRCTLKPQSDWLCRCFSFPKGISSGLKA